MLSGSKTRQGTPASASSVPPGASGQRSAIRRRWAARRAGPSSAAVAARCSAMRAPSASVAARASGRRASSSAGHRRRGAVIAGVSHRPGPIRPAFPTLVRVIPDLTTLPPMDVAGRADRLRAALADAGGDALLVTNLTNVRYLTGFTGSAALLLV